MQSSWVRQKLVNEYNKKRTGRCTENVHLPDFFYVLPIGLQLGSQRKGVEDLFGDALVFCKVCGFSQPLSQALTILKPAEQISPVFF